MILWHKNWHKKWSKTPRITAIVENFADSSGLTTETGARSMIVGRHLGDGGSR
jgi:hypothetical protein